MVAPRSVIIPFAVPVDARGLGLGLAALLHGFTAIDGRAVGLAQLVPRAREDVGGPDASPSGPLEAFIPPGAWREMAAQWGAAPEVSVVVTGSFEPPGEGRGMIQLLAFDPTDGATRAQAEAHIDCARAGETLLGAFGEVWAKVGGELGLVRDIGELSWDVIESLLRAERCVLHDPLRNGPHDRLAAMLHLGRAVGDAPLARFPAGRLAAVALETAGAPNTDARLASAALRALSRATEDAPAQPDLLEASAALEARLGDARAAAAHASAAIGLAPERGRLYALLSEARRALGDLDGALDAVDAGLREVRDDGLLASERAAVLAQRGDLAGAERGWRRVLAEDAVYPSAFVNLAGIAAAKKDLGLAQALVDEALAAAHARPEVLRRAIHLAVATEPEGVPRAARVAKLAALLVDRVPGDAWGALVLAQSHVRLGESALALVGFARVWNLAPRTALAAEAQRERLACADPQGAAEVEAILRAAEQAAPSHLEGVVARARALGSLHGVWTAAFARGVAERRRGNVRDARGAFEDALAIADGATPAHLELVELCIKLEEPAVALKHARRAVELEGRTVRALTSLAAALLAGGEPKDALAVVTEARALAPDREALGMLAARAMGAEAERPKARRSLWRRLFERR